MLVALIESSMTGFDTMVSDAVGILTDTSYSGTLWVTVRSLSDNLKPFCNIIVGICLLIELANVAAKVDIIRWEHGLKIGVKACLAKASIDIAPTFLLACYRQAQLWITNINSGTTITFGSETARALRTLVDSVSGIGNILGLFVSVFIVILAVKICGLMIKVIAYGRIFEIYVYLVVSPLPCAFFPLGNGDGGGVSRITTKFLKSFIAVCLQGVMMIVVIFVFDKIMGTFLTSAISAAATNTDANAAITDLIYNMLLGSVALVMAIVKCGSWAKGIIDAM